MPRQSRRERAEFLMRNNTINELRKKASDRDLSGGGSKRDIADRLASYYVQQFDKKRRGGNTNKVSQLMVGDTLRNKWGQKMKVERVEGGVAYARHGRRSSREGELVEITNADLADLKVRTPGDTKRYWSDYTGESGYRKM